MIELNIQIHGNVFQIYRRISWKIFPPINTVRCPQNNKIADKEVMMVFRKVKAFSVLFAICFMLFFYCTDAAANNTFPAKKAYRVLSTIKSHIKTFAGYRFIDDTSVEVYYYSSHKGYKDGACTFVLLTTDNGKKWFLRSNGSKMIPIE